MHERIKRIIDEKGLQPSSFADKIQVSRGTISHILNGRNDPSKDTIDKILEKFPDISSSWFLRGEGPMYNRERIFVQPVSSSSAIQPDLFDEKKSPESPEKPPEHESASKNEIKKAEDQTNSTIIRNINIPPIPAKKINKIMIFFSDKTFMTFIPEE